MSQKGILKESSVTGIWSLLEPSQRRGAVVLLALMLVGMVLEMLGIGLVVPALALFTQKDITLRYPALQPMLDFLGNPDQMTLVIGGLLVLLGVYGLKAFFLAFLAWRQSRFVFSLQAQLSQRLFTTYLLKPYAYHLQRNSAELIRNATTEVWLFTNRVMFSIMLLLKESLVLAGLCALLLVVEPLGAMIVVGLFVFFGWGFYVLTRKYVSRWGKARHKHDGLRIQHIQQGIGGVKDVKVLGRESEFLAQFAFHNQKTASVGERETTMQQIPRLWIELIAVGTLVFLVMTMIVRDGTLDGVIPKLGLFAAAAFRLMPSVNRMLSSLQTIRFGMPVIEMLHKELDPQITASQMPPRKEEKMPFSRELRLDGVSYGYPSALKPAIRDVSLSVFKGETVGFIGSSGAGKSTIVDLILGLFAPDSGSIAVDGKNISENLRGWQNCIGYVPQSIFLTDDTVRKNVAFGMPDDLVDDTAVQAAIRAAQLEAFVEGLAEGVETIVGERGVRLSGGQRQRIGIARALYHDPAVLVLDEATSALDTGTEQGVMEAVEALHGEKTIIIVAHRLSTVEQCDRIYRFEQGRIVEKGDAGEVLRSLRHVYGSAADSSGNDRTQGNC
ncbi:ATPase [Prosthecochloris sp. GSB1]|uniref:ABC transporter ATP-binding protein n=1 Tax=Prosthecochloris sp. GSB1 TaxID=281093 RepID=UPI000B8C85BC|nr:ABC transporter ATP-binding protein [Prosthecochloris sp. GSB1]ASQ89827.1 ATPase [Prosthecochloris sp. GSB1]